MELKLADAIKKGDLELVKSRLKNGALINEIEEDGFTPLGLAICCEHYEIASLLIAHGADVNRGIIIDVNRHYMSTLTFAIAAPDKKLLDLLIKNGAKVEVSLLDYIPRNVDLNSFGYLEKAKLIINALLIENPQISKPQLIKSQKELSSFWDEQAAKIKLLDKEFSSKNAKKIIFARISQDAKKTTSTPRSLLSQAFFKLPVNTNISQESETSTSSNSEQSQPSTSTPRP